MQLSPLQLSTVELRVVGSLVEKELATPQHYPLTLNALVAACNQTSNRDPVADYDEDSVEEAVTSAKGKGLVRFVHPSHGRSALRYRHELAEQLGLDERQLAIMAELVLRGPQTVGELRGRCVRMADVGTVADVEAELEALAARSEPLVIRVGRAPGQKEDRYAQLLGVDAVAPSEPPARSAAPTAVAGSRSEPGEGVSSDLAESVAQLRSEVDGLRRDLDDLRRQVGA